jgi:hypothetical protein
MSEWEIDIKKTLSWNAFMKPKNSISQGKETRFSCYLYNGKLKNWNWA